MKIVTWNVNSIRTRLEQTIEWLRAEKPDVVLLQELKVMNEIFPNEPFEDIGYNVAIHGQKSYNGVGILSLKPIDDVVKGLPTFDHDPQARYIEAVIGTVRVASVYVPNGSEVGSDKFAYKLDFLKALQQHLVHLKSFEEICVIGGDFNVAPTDLDVYNPDLWKNKILCSPPERAHFQSLLNTGYEDAIRMLHPEEVMYTWWDYRTRSWERGGGLRIDHLLVSPKGTPCLHAAGVDKYMRANLRASDHAPVWCEIKED